jgi:hypothetical protein
LKLDEILRAHPSSQTLAVLWGEPATPDAKRTEKAQELIRGQRDAQVDILVGLMRSPVLANLKQRRAEGIEEPSEIAPLAAFELRNPRRTARLFIDHTARTGRVLYHFGIETIEQLERRDERLGQLLWRLAIGQGSRRDDRRYGVDRWLEVTWNPWDDSLGAVLTPMVARWFRKDSTFGLQPLIDALTRTQAEPVEASAHLLGGATSGLAQWTPHLVREGATRLRELADRGDPLRA